MASVRFSKKIQLATPVERAWQAMIDVKNWPAWTASVTSVKRLDSGEFSVGSRARIRQPKLLPALWTVTELEPGNSFTWISSMPGVRVSGCHEVNMIATGSQVVLEVVFDGVFAGF